MVLQQYLNTKLLMNYVTDRKQIYNNTIMRVIAKLNQNKTISTTKNDTNELR